MTADSASWRPQTEHREDDKQTRRWSKSIWRRRKHSRRGEGDDQRGRRASPDAQSDLLGIGAVRSGASGPFPCAPPSCCALGDFPSATLIASGNGCRSAAAQCHWTAPQSMVFEVHNQLLTNSFLMIIRKKKWGKKIWKDFFMFFWWSCFYTVAELRPGNRVSMNTTPCIKTGIT